jgi:hypothetical protein
MSAVPEAVSKVVLWLAVHSVFDFSRQNVLYEKES